GGVLAHSIGWTLRLAYSFQQALDMTTPGAASYKNKIPYTPEHSGSAMLGFQYRRWATGYNLLFSGTRYTLGENNPYNQLDGWGTHDVFLSRRVELKNCALLLKAEVNNLSGAAYDIIRYYPMPGRSYKISLSINHL
ncbi:MAG: TonB-dependent receptor, partial [Bacteroidetes bacterium]|nr:TonB-dependent receptor [Bacteroidota bacterium]